MPIARDFVDSTVVSWASGTRIGRVHVDAVMSGQNDGPVIVVKLSGEEELAGKTIVLRAMVSVVLVRGDGVASKAAVLRYICRKLIVMAEKDRLAIAANRQLGRNGSVKGPKCQRPLIGQVGMELGMNALAIFGVDLGAFLTSLNGDLWSKFIKALMCPILSRRTAFN